MMAVQKLDGQDLFTGYCTLRVQFSSLPPKSFVVKYNTPSALDYTQIPAAVSLSASWAQAQVQVQQQQQIMTMSALTAASMSEQLSGYVGLAGSGTLLQQTQPAYGWVQVQ